MPVPNTFANATSAIPLSQLDNNFATAITLGNTAIQLGNTVTTLNNMTLANVTISSVSTPITAAQGGTGLTAVGSSGNVLTSNGTTWISQAPAAATGNVTIGNTTINIGGTATTVGNLTLTNATISSVSTPITVAQGGTGATTLTANNVILGNGTAAVQFVAPGTNGNVLSSNGTAWVSTAAAGGGSWIFLSSVTANVSATIDVETTFDSTYDYYAVVLSGVRVSNIGQTLRSRLKIGGTYQTGGAYGYVLDKVQAGVSPTSFSQVVDTANTSDHIPVTFAADNGSYASINVVGYISNPASTTLMKQVSYFGSFITSDTTNAAARVCGVGAWKSSTAALTGIRFFAGAGNITSGTFRLYGIKNS